MATALRHRPRPQCGEFSAAHAVVVSGARRGRLSRRHRDRPRQAVLELPAVLCPCAQACLGAHAPRRQTRRHGLGDARQHAGHARGALRRADGGRRAQHAQYPARRRDPRLHARSRRNQSADRRSRIFQGDEGGAGHRQGEAARYRLRRPGIHRRRRAPRRDRIRGFAARRRSKLLPGRCRATNGTRSRSIIRRAPPAIPRAWSITIAALICSRSATSSLASMGKHPVYLWTLPMFHCNGWCFPWTLSIVAGTHVCLRAVRAAPIFYAIATQQGHASVRRADRDVDAAQRAGGRAKAVAA